ncbi:MAG TPA: hypothetical protein VFA20_01195 [Myxococcaceae bacterium]|nr:hypothetical protein [Myxococcaceae bacterium]
MACFAFLSLCSACTPAASVPTTSAPAPAAPAPPAAASGSVAALLAQHPSSGAATVTGYVTYIYRCPPCPPGAMCKPCMGDNLVLSDAPKQVTDYADVGDGDLVVLADRAKLDAFKVGSRYRLDLDIGPEKHLSNLIPDPHLKSAVAAP